MTEDGIKAIEEEIRKTPYNKATQGHIGRLKAKLARMKTDESQRGGGKHGLGYAIRKQGDATVILVGYPSVGKSTLLNQLTNAASKVAEYEFTTLTVVPGVLEYRGAKIQILDVPGLVESAAEGRGRGREVLSVLRNGDLLIILLAGPSFLQQKTVIENELEQAGFRLNARKPDVRITKKGEGGIRIETVGKQTLTNNAIREIVREYSILNGEILIRQKKISMDQLIDCLEGNRVYLPALFVVNKTDLLSGEVNRGRGFLRMSALKKEGIEEFRKRVWNMLQLKRIFLKKPGKKPDMEEPLIMRGRVTVRHVAEKIHLAGEYGKLWGPSARFDGQKVGLTHLLKDGDVVEIHE